MIRSFALCLLILAGCAPVPEPQQPPIVMFQRYNDSVAIYVPGERATMPLDTLRQALINRGIIQ